METIEKYYKITAKQEYEKNPKLSVADVDELLQWSNENINIHGKFIGQFLCTVNTLEKINNLNLKCVL